jgi:dipeptidyl aminopeptidase/acylaminoacyl peptidase
MRPELERLLGVTQYQAFDTDDGGRILAGSNESGSTQLAEISPDGRLTALTALPGACTGRYVPGERAVIVSHDAGGNERHQLSLLTLPAPGAAPARPAAAADLRPLVRDPAYMHTLAAVAGGRICYFTNRRDGVAFDAVIRDLATGAERTLVLGDVNLSQAAISPDGRWLALTVESAVTANAQHVALVALTGPPGQERITEVTPADAPAMNVDPAWLPGSDALTWSSNNDREFLAIARYDLATGQRSWVITDDGADLTGWPSPDGSLVLVERNDDGASVLTVHDLASGSAQCDVPLPAPGRIARAASPEAGWSPDSASVTVTVSGAQLPGDVLAADAATGSVRQVTFSAAGLNGTPVAIPRRHQIPAPDGELVPCLVYPAAAGADPALAGSAVLVVHGGPEGQAVQNFNPYVQLLAAAGHTVLVPNVRGSTGYGKRWYSLDDKERRLDSVADLAAVHAYLPALGLDPGRAALWGGSYGGYMVLAGLAFQPGRWAAGVAIVAISSLVSFLENTSAYRRAYREREYGTLAADREFLLAASPLTRIDQVRAPLFLIHGANDPRVPLSEAEQIHAALTERGRECELLVYGDEGHGLAKRANRADAMPRALAFLARHLSARHLSAG